MFSTVPASVRFFFIQRHQQKPLRLHLLSIDVFTCNDLIDLFYPWLFAGMTIIVIKTSCLIENSYWDCRDVIGISERQLQSSLIVVEKTKIILHYQQVQILKCFIISYYIQENIAVPWMFELNIYKRLKSSSKTERLYERRRLRLLYSKHLIVQ